MNQTKNRIELEFDKTMTVLAGNRYGRAIYQEQVKNSIDENIVNCIVIPARITDIASSFIQGMYSELSEKWGREQATKIMELYSEDGYVREKIAQVMKTML